MLAIHYSHKSAQDLENIWFYSFKQWREKQADKYFDELSLFLNKTLSKNPQIGVACDHIIKGYRQYRVNEHFIFYKLMPNRIFIVRILHKNMKFEKHL